MNIAIVSGYFYPEIGYQEVYLAKAFSRLGHHVRVITGSYISKARRKTLGRDGYEVGLRTDEQYGYDLHRLNHYFRFRSAILARKVASSLREFKPDYIVVVALGQMFSFPVFEYSKRKDCRLIIVGSEAGESRNRLGAWNYVLSLLQDLGFRFFKRWLYLKAVRESDRIILNYPETARFYETFLPASLSETFHLKAIQLHLGFDPDTFFFSEDDRNAARKDLGIQKDEVLLVTVTSINKQKRIEEFVDIVSWVTEQGVKIKYLIIGFLGDRYETELKEYIKKQNRPDLFICKPFLSQKEVRRLYAASDLGIWRKAAISIQESMGTGLYVMLENKTIVGHLLDHGKNGAYYVRDQLPTALLEVCRKMAAKTEHQRIAERKHNIATNGNKFSYDSIACRIIESI